VIPLVEPWAQRETGFEVLLPPDGQSETSSGIRVFAVREGKHFEEIQNE